jgi:hypothetical protein
LRVAAQVDVVVFGADAPMRGQGITARNADGQTRTMMEEARLLGEALAQNFGQAVKFRYVDVQSDEMWEFPQISGLLNSVGLPLTAIDGEPKFHGGFPFGMIAAAIYGLLK